MAKILAVKEAEEKRLAEEVEKIRI